MKKATGLEIQRLFNFSSTISRNKVQKLQFTTFMSEKFSVWHLRHISFCHSKIIKYRSDAVIVKWSETSLATPKTINFLKLSFKLSQHIYSQETIHLRLEYHFGVWLLFFKWHFCCSIHINFHHQYLIFILSEVKYFHGDKCYNKNMAITKEDCQWFPILT